MVNGTVGCAGGVSPHLQRQLSSRSGQR